MAAHRFQVGQTVQFRTKPFYVSVALGAFEVTKQLPERDGEFEYRIKNVAEPHERVGAGKRAERRLAGGRIRSLGARRYAELIRD
jgi:hypothetical protein